MPRYASRPARSKYGSQITEVDGIKFRSKREATRYGELKLMERAGLISDIRLQPRFVLCPWMLDHSDIRPLGEYRADFGYTDERTGRDVIEDVKGFRTPLYKWKKKHVEAQYGIEIREV